MAEGIEAQFTADGRVWPLGAKAPRSYGGGLNILWFPNIAQGKRNLYFLVGGGGAWVDPPAAAVGLPREARNVVEALAHVAVPARERALAADLLVGHALDAVGQ